MQKIFKHLKYAAVVWVESISQLIFLLPRFRLLNYLKSRYLSFLYNAKIGKRVVFYSGVWIFTGKNLVLGDDVDLARGVLITSDGGVEVGDRVLIGYYTQILSSNHVIANNKGRIFGSGHIKSKVSIGSDTWIGANCIILPGVTIGKGVVVAAGSVVSKNLPDYTVCAGVPCKVIRERA